MRFVCFGYADIKTLEAKPEAEMQRLFKECLAYDDELRKGGHFVAGQALESGEHTVTIRSHKGKVEAINGPFVETKEQIGGILHLEARDLNHAIELISKHPGVQMGPWEIRPMDDYVMKMIEERNAAFAAKN